MNLEEILKRYKNGTRVRLKATDDSLLRGTITGTALITTEPITLACRVQWDVGGEQLKNHYEIEPLLTTNEKKRRKVS